jgi:hypothetical protein
MKTTWGCWYKCNFCYTWRVTGGTPYSRSPESIAAELETIDAEDVYIVDDIFLINRTRLAKLAALLRERNIRKKYLVYARADFIAENEDVIAEWARLGLRAVFIGLEAATNRELDAMEKMATVDHNRRAIAVLRRRHVRIVDHATGLHGRGLAAAPGFHRRERALLSQHLAAHADAGDADLEGLPGPAHREPARARSVRPHARAPAHESAAQEILSLASPNVPLRQR